MQTINEEEAARLQKFVASPYFNEQEELTRLLGFLLGFWPEFTAESLDKRACFAAVFPGRPYEDKRYRYMASNLYQLVERFWVVEQQKQETLRNEVLLMDSLSSRRLDKGYQHSHRRIDRYMKQQTARNSEYFLQQLHWAEAEERHFGRQRLRQYDASIQRAADMLDRYYHLRKLRFACGMMDRQTIIKGDYSLNISNHWLAHLRESKI